MSDFHSIRFQRWNDEINGSQEVGRITIERGQEIPWEKDYKGQIYRQGQCSGSAKSIVWFDLIE